MYNAFVELMVWKSNANMVDPWGYSYLNGSSPPNYLGHRDIGQTACPGDYMYAHLNGFRNDAYARYSPVPIRDDILGKWNSLYGAPGAALDVEYPVYGYDGAWIGQAQDFQVNGQTDMEQKHGQRVLEQRGHPRQVGLARPSGRLPRHAPERRV